MLSGTVRRFALGTAAFALAVSVLAAPSGAQAAGLASDPTSGLRDIQWTILHPDVAVQTHGTETNNGTLYFKFSLKNIGPVTAKNVKTTKKLVYRYKFSHLPAGESTAIVNSASIAPGGVTPMTKMCDAPPTKYCDYATVSVEVTGSPGETNTSNNFGKIES